MDEFHLDMGVRFTPDEDSVKEIDKLFDSFRKIKVFGGDENIAKMREQFDDYNTRRSSLQQAQSMLDQYRAAQGKGDKFEDATTIVTIRVRLPKSGATKQQVMLLIPEHHVIEPLFDINTLITKS